MDAIDRKILAVLQEEGRLTITELAARVGEESVAQVLEVLVMKHVVDDRPLPT